MLVENEEIKKELEEQRLKLQLKHKKREEELAALRKKLLPEQGPSLFSPGRARK